MYVCDCCCPGTGANSGEDVITALGTSDSCSDKNVPLGAVVIFSCDIKVCEKIVIKNSEIVHFAQLADGRAG